MIELTKNFSREELECPCCGACEMSGELLADLQRIRDVIGRPFKITSGYRCKDHNTEIGGSPTSRHMSGEAVDINVVGWNSLDLHDLIDEFTSHVSSGVGIYRTYVHFDVRDKRTMWIR